MFVIEGELHGVVCEVGLEGVDVRDDIVSDCAEFELIHMTILR